MAIPTKKRTRRGEERTRGKSRTTRRSREVDDDLEEDDDQGAPADVDLIVTRFGNAKAAVAKLLGDRHTATQQKKRALARADQLEEELNDLLEALGIDSIDDLPEKPKVVSEADAADLEAYRGLSTETEPAKKLGDVKKKVEDHGKLTETVAKDKGKELMTKAATAAKVDPDVLEGMATLLNLDIEVKPIKDGEATTDVVFVREKKDGAEQVRLDKFLEDDPKAKKYKVALMATSEDGGQDSTSSSSTNGGGGTPYPRTTGGSSSTTRDLVGSTVGSRDFRPSKAGAKAAGT